MHTENDRDYALSQQTDYAWRRVEKGKIEKYKAGHQRYGAKRLEKAAEVQKMAGRFHALMRKEESVETQLLAPQPNGRLRSRLQPAGAAERNGHHHEKNEKNRMLCACVDARGKLGCLRKSARGRRQGGCSGNGRLHLRNGDGVFHKPCALA